MRRRMDLINIQVFGVDEDLIDRFYFRSLVWNLLKHDEFVKELDQIAGTKIATKKTIEEREEEFKFIAYNTTRNLIAINLAIRYLSYLADKGLDEVLDEYWRDRLKKFKGFNKK